METTLAHPPQLTAADRCDRCGAQAYVRVQFTATTPLLFCRHHYLHHEAGIAEAPGLRSIVDETALLFPVGVA